VEDKTWWFPAKRYGWGWGLPVRWQGWVVLAVYLGLVLAGVRAFKPLPDPVPFITYISLLSLLLTLICWAKGEPPRWRWGKD
jgi:hypothetical protein